MPPLFHSTPMWVSVVLFKRAVVGYGDDKTLRFNVVPKSGVVEASKRQDLALALIVLPGSSICLNPHFIPAKTNLL